MTIRTLNVLHILGGLGFTIATTRSVAYDPSFKNWEAYEECLEMFLVVISVAKRQRVITLLTVIGGTAYKIVQDLVAPTNPKDLTYEELKDFCLFFTKTSRYCQVVHFSQITPASRGVQCTFVAERHRFSGHWNF